MADQQSFSTGPDGEALVAVGSNRAFKSFTSEDVIRNARKLLEQNGYRIVAESPLFQTPAFPPGAGPDFLNAVWVVHGVGAPRDFLSVLHDLEATFGRRRDERWGPRTLDLDLLAVGDIVLPDETTWRNWADLDPADQRNSAPEGLILPHPRLQERAFVLVPLREAAPEWKHPVTGLTAADMLARLPVEDLSAIRRLA